MKQHFPKPSEPSFEAWFMGDIKYVNWLTDLPVEEYEVSELDNYLFDTCAGIKNFERFEEWVLWYQYLLPYLSTRIMDGNLLCLTITYFFNVYPSEIIEEYPGFRDDELKVLPYFIMSAELYRNGDLAISSGLDRDDPILDWFMEGSYWENSLNATMFFCLKYLTAEEIRIWIESINTLKSEWLKTEIDFWFAKARRFLRYILQPEYIPRNTDILKRIKGAGLPEYLTITGIDWFPSELVFEKAKTNIDVVEQLNKYLPQENIHAFLAALTNYKFD